MLVVVSRRSCRDSNGRNSSVLVVVAVVVVAVVVEVVSTSFLLFLIRKHPANPSSWSHKYTDDMPPMKI